MEIDPDERPAPRPPRHRFGIVDIGVAALLVLTGIVCLANGLQWDRQAEDAETQFMASPICSSRAVDSTDCRLNAPMMVTKKWTRYGSHGGGGGKHYYLGMRTYSGETYTAEMTGADPFWDALLTGQIISTQRWHDNVVSMSSGGTRAITTSYLGPTGGELHHFFAGFAGACLAAFVCIFVFVCIRAAQGR